MRISTTRTGRPTIRARTRRGSARKRPSHRHRRLSHRRGFPSHRARRRPRGYGVRHELARRLAAAGLRALAAFRRFCRVAASLDQSGPAERCGRGLHLLELGRSAARAARNECLGSAKLESIAALHCSARACPALRSLVSIPSSITNNDGGSSGIGRPRVALLDLWTSLRQYYHASFWPRQN